MRKWVLALGCWPTLALAAGIAHAECRVVSTAVGGQVVRCTGTDSDGYFGTVFRDSVTVEDGASVLSPSEDAINTDSGDDIVTIGEATVRGGQDAVSTDRGHDLVHASGASLFAELDDGVDLGPGNDELVLIGSSLQSRDEGIDGEEGDDLIVVFSSEIQAALDDAIRGGDDDDEIYVLGASPLAGGSRVISVESDGVDGEDGDNLIHVRNASIRTLRAGTESAVEGGEGRDRVVLGPGTDLVGPVVGRGGLDNLGFNMWVDPGEMAAAAAAIAGADPAFDTVTIAGAQYTWNGFEQISDLLNICVTDPFALCLNDNRFRVSVEWTDFFGNRGQGRAISLTGDTGMFWFFDSQNIELILKVLDGRAVNGHFWVFYGALSDVAYTLTVTDTLTGEERVYTNPARQFASRGDTTGFADSGNDVSAAKVARARSFSGRATDLDAGARAAPGATAARGADTCSPACTTLCLADGRFAVQVAWSDFQGGSGDGRVVDLTRDTGSFWFFDSENIELVVKVLDGRPINGHFWVFYGALSNVEYTLTVTDTVTGLVKTYFNPRGQFGSRGDTAALPAD